MLFKIQSQKGLTVDIKSNSSLRWLTGRIFLEFFFDFYRQNIFKIVIFHFNLIFS